jgi:hypothetical protein
MVLTLTMIYKNLTNIDTKTYVKRVLFFFHNILTYS